MELTIDILIAEAKNFSQIVSEQNHTALIGVTDGKAVGTYVEHLFQNYLSSKYTMSVGSSAYGIDLPSVNTETLKQQVTYNRKVAVLSNPLDKKSLD